MNATRDKKTKLIQHLSMILSENEVGLDCLWLLLRYFARLTCKQSYLVVPVFCVAVGSIVTEGAKVVGVALCTRCNDFERRK